MFTEALGFKNAPFHERWYELLQPMNDPEHFSPLRKHLLAKKKFHLEGPRKHGKSQCIAINYPSWLIGKYPDIHITIVSKTATLAENSLSEIMTRAETDPKYLEIFGEIRPRKPQKWSATQIYVKRRIISKFPTIHATGLYGPLTGGGNDLIIADDIIDEENVTSKRQIEKVSLWFHKVLLTTLFPKGACLAIGTRWHYSDLYRELLESWPNEVLKAIINEKEILVGEPPKVLWPEVWSYEDLLSKKKDIGTVIFNCQYQNDPTGMEGDLLKREWLHSWSKPPDNKQLIFYAAVDPALGEGDLAAISIGGFDSSISQMYLFDVWAERLGPPGFFKKLREFHVEYNFAKIYVESNAFQRVLTFIPEFTRGLPTTPTHTDSNKHRRIIAMSSHFESKRVLINPAINNIKHEFISEWIQFPRGEYVDALDSTEILLRNVIGKPQPWVIVA